MINLVIKGCDTDLYGNGEEFGWIVKHPQNSAILAYCDSFAEANQVKKDLIKLAKKYEKNHNRS